MDGLQIGCTDVWMVMVCRWGEVMDGWGRGGHLGVLMMKVGCSWCADGWMGMGCSWCVLIDQW